MKLKLLVLVVCLHILFVAIAAFSNITLTTNKANNRGILQWVKTITSYTVMQADYAFFSPDVGAAPSQFLKVQTANDSFYVPLEPLKTEAGIRVFTSLNAFNQTPQARELMARSWGAQALKIHPDAYAITVSYYLKNPLSLKQNSSKHIDGDSLLFEVKYQVHAE